MCYKNPRRPAAPPIVPHQSCYNWRIDRQPEGPGKPMTHLSRRAFLAAGAAAGGGLLVGGGF
ncbi:MAG: hypothetical protein O2905_07340, partial [Proteobacteria bacterium]|nr:hypothetical protein [Pseudomonadota bacterium]